MLRQVFYVSRAAHALGAPEVQSILLTSQRNNRHRDVTGCLMYSGRHFAQTLEGAPRDLAPLLERIIADPRHNACQLLLDHPIERRRYPDWSMGYLYSLDLVDRLEALLAGPSLSRAEAIEAMSAMTTDSVMGSL